MEEEIIIDDSELIRPIDLVELIEDDSSKQKVNITPKGRQTITELAKKLSDLLSEQDIEFATSWNRLDKTLEKMTRTLNGGKGSGNFGHSGRPGKVGGSTKGSGGRTKAILKKVAEGIAEYDPDNEIDGGFTIEKKTVQAYKLGKSKGFAVGGFGTEKVVSLDDRDEAKKAIADYMEQNKKALSRKGACLGGWVPSSGELKGKLVLDVSRVFKSERQAAIAMVKTDQDSITDFAGYAWPTQDELVKKHGLQELQKKYKGLRAAERSS